MIAQPFRLCPNHTTAKECPVWWSLSRCHTVVVFGRVLGLECERLAHLLRLQFEVMPPQYIEWLLDPHGDAVLKA
jgi:hypothetical protein